MMPVELSSNFTYDITNIACHDYCVREFVNDYNNGLAQATNSISNLIILNLASALILFVCTSKRMKKYLESHPQNARYISFLQGLAMLGVVGFSWMLFIFGILHIGIKMG